MDQNTAETLPELQVDHESGAYFKEAARWGNFLAVIYFICIGLFVLALLFVGAAFFGNRSAIFPSDADSTIALPQPSAVQTATQALAGLTVFALFIYGGLMLYRFASRCREGIERQDQLAFNSGLQALRNYFICTGIVAIIGLINNAIALISL